MTFESILYAPGDESDAHASHELPACARDLNLDQIVAAITAGAEEYDLVPLFYAPLKSVDAVRYRHEVMRDLEHGALLESLRAFAEHMRAMRQQMVRAERLYDRYQRERWLLHAAQRYCSAVDGLVAALSRANPASRGFRDFQEYLTAYTASDAFVTLKSDARTAAAALAEIRYSVVLRDNGFSVRAYEGEPDYSAEVTATFEKFRQGAVQSYLVALPATFELNSVEAKILEFVAQLFPDAFGRLATFCERHRAFSDSVVTRFDREIQFYLSFLAFMQRFAEAGLVFAYPTVSERKTPIKASDAFDLALALRCVSAQRSVVCNDVVLEGNERVLVISGANQGGKTTFSRTVGQLHHFAALGCPVAASVAQLFLCDAIYTHFEREESSESLRGKLEDDLIRMRDILERATDRSLIIVNEIFSSTTVSDALALATSVFERLFDLDCICVCVTFLDELASLSEKTVSMVSMVAPENPAVRTYKVVRRPAEGRAYAISVAERHGLTYERIKRRLDGERQS